jgi:hypothetical protein
MSCGADGSSSIFARSCLTKTRRYYVSSRLQKLVLLRRELHGEAVLGDAAIGEIDARAEAHDIAGGAGVTRPMAKRGAQAGEQFADREGLLDIVVGPDVVHDENARRAEDRPDLRIPLRLGHSPSPSDAAPGRPDLAAPARHTGFAAFESNGSRH